MSKKCCSLGGWYTEILVVKVVDDFDDLMVESLRLEEVDGRSGEKQENLGFA